MAAVAVGILAAIATKIFMVNSVVVACLAYVNRLWLVLSAVIGMGCDSPSRVQLSE